MLAISTPLEEQNYYSQLLMQKDPVTGEPFFNTIRINLICEDCKKLEHEQMIKCTHNVSAMPPWKNTRRHARYARLYQGQEALGLRENAGIVTNDGTPAFPPEAIDMMFNLPRQSIDKSPDYMFMTVDPNGGGPSKLAVMSGYLISGGRIVVSSQFVFYFFCICYMLVKPYNACNCTCVCVRVCLQTHSSTFFYD